MKTTLDAITAFLAKHQAPLAFACVALLALQFLKVYTLPHGIEMALVFCGAWLGVSRPTEAAAKMAGEVASAKGGVSVGALLALLAGLMLPPATDTNPVEPQDTQEDMIDVIFTPEEKAEAASTSGAEEPELAPKADLG